MKKMTDMCSGCACLWMMLLLGACGNLDNRKTIREKPRRIDKIQIGMSFDSFVIERWQRDRDIFVSTAKELGAEVNVQNAQRGSGTAEESRSITSLIKEWT
ncbi:MAG: hypothetical protein ACLR6I_06785 [Waltera sp.]